MATEATSRAGEAPLAAQLPPDTLRQWLRDMLLIREFEVRTMQAYQNRQVGGFCHVYIGQEAVAVGCTAAARDDDPIITAYRDHGHALARGMDPKYGMAELFGRIGGCAKGKGGSMHFFDASRHMYGGHGIVAAQTPLGAGLAFATKYEDEVIGRRKSDRVTLCFFGDGALNQGAFHESMNLAGILDLPVLFICENNGYSMGTSISRGTTMGHEITAKAAAYGMDSASIDGMDIMAVYDGIRPMIDRCRETSRPAFIEMRTYRYKGHSMSDPRKYRTKEEEEEYEAKDAIEKLVEHLKREHGFTDDEHTAMTKDVKKQVRAAMKWANDSPVPDNTELYTDVYTGYWGPYQGTSLPEMMRE
ncbi:MAG: pyruvate dehydrogenase (acetyl-transferring) E1 component subunit alpha [Planctomycetota bacterium]|nr:pyruvate dehydrogenase (acetyl-transferring) E1 component subunit alpha [Planctomycetota bacterium]